MIRTFLLGLGGATALLLINAYGAKPTPTNALQEEQPQKISSLEMPQSANFAGEIAPLNVSDVRERFDRELLINTYWQSNILLYFKRSNQYFPTIEKILAQHGVPDDFKYLALIESGLQNVVSPAGAAGFWQFMKDTAIEHNLEISDTIDERYHLEKATHAACQYLKKRKSELGSWTLAAAAYNAGKTGIATQMEKQRSSNYYDLLLTSETSRYVFRIIAVKEIMQNPEKYGIHLKAEHLYQAAPTQEIQVSHSIESLADFAIAKGTNYKTLKLLNPWLRDYSLKNPQNKTYTLKLPL